MAQPPGEGVEQPLAGLHRLVDGQHVRDVEAEAGLRQRGEVRRELGDRAAGRLARVHVLQHEARAQRPVRARVVHRVGVHDDRVDQRRDLRQPPHELGLRHPQVLHGRVHAQVAERQLRLRRPGTPPAPAARPRTAPRARPRTATCPAPRRPSPASRRGCRPCSPSTPRADGAGRRRRTLRAVRGPWNPGGYGAGRTESRDVPALWGERQLRLGRGGEGATRGACSRRERAVHLSTRELSTPRFTRAVDCSG